MPPTKSEPFRAGENPLGFRPAESGQAADGSCRRAPYLSPRPAQLCFERLMIPRPPSSWWSNYCESSVDV